MASVFSTEQTATSVLDVVRQSLDVSSTGDVSFKSRTGRGSGAPVVIPGDQFDEFVELMVATKDSREALTQKQKEVESASATSTNEETSSEEE